MPRISSGACGWSSCSGGRVGVGGFSAKSGVATALRWASFVGTGSGRVVVAGRLLLHQEDV